MIVQLWLRKQRDVVLRIIRSHPYYCDQHPKGCEEHPKGRLEIEEECITFFDRRYTFQVLKLTGEEDCRHYLNRDLVLRLGGTEATLFMNDLEVGSYNQNELDTMNEEFWKELVIKNAELAS